MIIMMMLMIKMMSMMSMMMIVVMNMYREGPNYFILVHKLEMMKKMRSSEDVSSEEME